jgi:hypothetical protein
LARTATFCSAWAICAASFSACCSSTSDFNFFSRSPRNCCPAAVARPLGASAGENG